MVRIATGVWFGNGVDARGEHRMVQPKGHGDVLRRPLFGSAHRQKRNGGKIAPVGKGDLRFLHADAHIRHAGAHALLKRLVQCQRLGLLVKEEKNVRICHAGFLRKMRDDGPCAVACAGWQRRRRRSRSAKAVRHCRPAKRGLYGAERLERDETAPARARERVARIRPRACATVRSR